MNATEMVRANTALLVGIGALAFGVAFGGAAPSDAQETRAAIDTTAEAVLARDCASCHEWQRVGDSRRTRAQWEMLLDDMTARGASVADEDYDIILAYALRHDRLVNVNQAPADEISTVIGLAPTDAEAIVKYRGEHGKFADFDALKKVPGIDATRLEAARLSILY